MTLIAVDLLDFGGSGGCCPIRTSQKGHEGVTGKEKNRNKK